MGPPPSTASSRILPTSDTKSDRLSKSSSQRFKTATPANLLKTNHFRDSKSELNRKRTGRKLKWQDDRGGSLSVNSFSDNLYYSASVDVIEVQSRPCCIVM